MKSKYIILCSFFCLFSVFYGAHAQNKYTISGYIRDAQSGERLKNASILLLNRNVGATSNNYGFFSITVDEGPIQMLVTYIGNSPYTDSFDLIQDKQLNISLQSAQSKNLETVVVTAKSKNTSIQNTTQMSANTIPMETMKALPRFLGEVDVLKTIQMLPGVQAGTEGQSGIYVRGGGPDQNLILLDGVPVYNVSHLFGFFSVFNADAIKSVEVIKGGFPARYGGRLSSIVDIQMKEGNQNKLHGEGGISLIAARLTLEGPFKQGKKSSFMISGRRTYIDVLAMPLIKANTEGVTAGYFFYDLNAKANFELSDKDHLYVSGYFGNDKFYMREKDADYQLKSGLKWGNGTAVLRWNHLFNKKLFGNLTAAYTRYLFDVTTEDKYTTRTTTELYYLRYYSGINDVSVKYDFDFIPNPKHYIKAGAGVVRHYYKPGAMQSKIHDIYTNTDTFIKNNFIKATEVDTYIEDDFLVTQKLKANIGLHFTVFNVQQKNFFALQPRIALRYLINKSLSIKASYAVMNQYINLLTNSGIGLPTDLWIPVTKKVPPQYAQQAALGLAYDMNSTYEFSVEGYYKKMKNLVEYQEGASFINATSNWEDKLTIGTGDSYGVEFFAQRKKGKWRGMVGYTLSWSNRTFPDLNFGKTFPYKYDRRHDLKLAAVYTVSEKVELSADFVFGTGQHVTIPTAQYVDANGNNIDIYTARNNYTYPSYNRLDVAVTFSKQKKKYTRAWVISIYNVYNRNNPFFIYKKNVYSNTGSGYSSATQFKQVSLFPIIPSISYQFKF